MHVVSGELHYFVNGHVEILRPGEGIVVNSSRLHYGFSPERRETWFSCAVISPTLFENLTADTTARCERAFAQHMEDFLHLTPDVDWQRDVLTAIERVIRLMPGGGMHGGRRGRADRNADAVISIGGDAAGSVVRSIADSNIDGRVSARGPAIGTTGTNGTSGTTTAVIVADPLPAVAAAIELCDKVLDRFQPNQPGDTGNDMAAEQGNRMSVLEMTGIIQRRFRDPLGLDDIAAAGGVSRSQCCILFNRYVGRTPNEYLTERRVEEARRLLRETNGSVAEIARACGFSTASYFVNVFRKRVGVTPGAFRSRP
ncbi:AraC family transcriptional regulator [Bifidobacterium biavatii]|uniref:AraC family transcriptional regulator n=1 Tax=Bifidobacterium biavatii TaxID=762212 RepID=UPI001EE67898|nr:AraC family transcriptional regulator [Bifidobacterium biavatii]